MESKFAATTLVLFALTLTLTLTLALPARAQTPVLPEEVPDNPALVDVPPLNRELSEDVRVFFDPRVNVVSFIGLLADDSDHHVALIAAGVGVDIHLRMTEYLSTVIGGSFVGGAELTGEVGGASAYDVGALLCVRANYDLVRGMLGLAFAEVRDRENELDMRAVMAHIVLEGGYQGLLGRLSLKGGVGWDGHEYQLGFAGGVELSAVYTF